MKALTLWQPWASLVALGVKTIETRSWSTSYRGPLAVHAGARHVHHGKFFLLARTARVAGSITGEDEAAFRALDVPFGAVVATCTLVDCIRTERIKWEPERFHVKGRIVEWSRFAGLPDHQDARIAEDQRPYGDFSPGRYAWLLAVIEPLAEPVPAKGRQGLWEWAA